LERHRDEGRELYDVLIGDDESAPSVYDQKPATETAIRGGVEELGRALHAKSQFFVIAPSWIALSVAMTASRTCEGSCEAAVWGPKNVLSVPSPVASSIDRRSGSPRANLVPVPRDARRRVPHAR